MEIKSKLMQKIGIMSANLSNEFIQLDVDDRIPTVAFLSEKYETARLSEIIRSSRDKFISWSYAITILKKI